MPRPSPSADHPRHRRDRCPGVLLPWVAADGALVRIRLVGGLLHTTQLAGLGELAARYGDGSLHLTTRANVQLRGLPVDVPEAFVRAVTDLGLLPSPAHERARNVLVSPLTGRLGGRADLRPLAQRLDRGLRSDPALAALPGRFLFALDDRGDLADRDADLAAVVVDSGSARLLAGGRAGEVVPLDAVPCRLLQLARRFVHVRGAGPAAAWHVRELAGGGASLGCTGDPPPAATSPPPPHGEVIQDDGLLARHVAVPGGTLHSGQLATVLDQAGRAVVVTPWRSLLLPDLPPDLTPEPGGRS